MLLDESTSQIDNLGIVARRFCFLEKNAEILRVFVGCLLTRSTVRSLQVTRGRNLIASAEGNLRESESSFRLARMFAKVDEKEFKRFLGALIADARLQQAFFKNQLGPELAVRIL